MARRLVLALLLAAATVARANTPLTITVHPGSGKSPWDPSRGIATNRRR
jgi:hypothetical protein